MESRPAEQNEKIQAQRAARILDQLEQCYPDARPMLHFSNPFECLVAVILSAQTTDEQVNRVTTGLFQSFPDAVSMAQADIDELEMLIHSVGLYRSKAKNLKAMAAMLQNIFDSAVPQELDQLLQLPGVGRKTANVVMAVAWGIPGFGVDTHVARLCQRLGLIDSSNPEQIERYMKGILPPERWVMAHHVLIFHGRRVCTAKKPRCTECVVLAQCPHYQLTSKTSN